MKLQDKHVGSTIGIIIGILFILAPLGNSELPTGTVFTGLLLILGSLSYKSKKKQILSKTKSWPILEVVTLALLLLHISFGINTEGFYYHPLHFIVVPAWVIISYAVLLITEDIIN